MIADGSIEARPGDDDPGAIALMHKLSAKSRERWPATAIDFPKNPAKASAEGLTQHERSARPPPWTLGSRATSLTVLLGVATGILSGLFGVGGGVISQPGMRLLGLEPLIVIGTALPVIIPGAASGSRRYQREGLIRWPAVAATVPDRAWSPRCVGSVAAEHVPGDGHLLQLATAGAARPVVVPDGARARSPAARGAAGRDGRARGARPARRRATTRASAGTRRSASSPAGCRAARDRRRRDHGPGLRPASPAWR